MQGCNYWLLAALWAGMLVIVCITDFCFTKPNGSIKATHHDKNHFHIN